MTDIIERLRRAAGLGLIDGGLMQEAASEIERLHKLLEDKTTPGYGFLAGSIEEKEKEIERLLLVLHEIAVHADSGAVSKIARRWETK